MLRALVDVRDRQVQKARIQFGNRVSALERGDDDGQHTDQLSIAQRWAARFEELEAELDKDIKAAVQEYPIYELMVEVKGVGPMTAAKLISMIDITAAPHVSSLWRYAGYAVIDGERERPVKGEKLHYNKRLKTACYLLGGSFLKSNSPYRAVYDRAREKYALTKPDWTKAHQHQAAMRKMIKMYLSHLWVVWRELEGLPVTEPYVHAHLGHEHYYSPAEFGWPVGSAAVVINK
jgi:hypothetical protein